MNETMPLFERAEADEDALWRAVSGRDARWDGRLIYGVRSTGIYCRPSCPSRRPKREGVRFFATPGEAARAGFRTCKRCRPDEADAASERVRQAREIIESSPDKPPSLSALAERVGMSPSHLRRTFTITMGVSPRQYAVALRAARLKEGLRESATVTAALNDAGYGSSRQAYEQAPELLGMTPAAYKRGGRGTAICFAVSPCVVGWILVASTERGVCSVMLGESEDALEARLRAEFPAADLRRDDENLGGFVNVLLHHLEGENDVLEMALDVAATAFQREVWAELRAIPRGETRSYAEVARAMGRPEAVRAVARACASNPTALVVPCHRVVRSDGGLSGFRWGIERKRALLERERRRV